MAVLILKSNDDNQHFPLFKNITRIGSDSTADVTLDGNNVAADHAHVLREGDAFVLASLGRGRPMQVNGKKEKRAKLKEGDVIEIGGAEPDRGLVVVGAHYDSVDGSPGANDNGTGVAAVLELARILKDRRPRRSVRLVAFVNEEPPFYYTNAMGSRRYATRLAEAGETNVAMLSLETIGYYSDDPGSQHYPFPLSFFYPDTGNFIGFVGNLRSVALVRQAVKSFRGNASFPCEGLAAPGWLTGVGWSDHWSFWRVGVPAIMVTDTALFRYREYHTPADRTDVVDYERLARVVDGLVHVVVDLANAGTQ